MRFARTLLPVLVIVAACGSPPTAEQAQPTAEAPTDAPATDGATGDGPASGGDVDEVLAELEGLTGDERRTRLLELAQEEGELSLYTSMSGPIADEVSGIFEDDFGIAVGLYRASSETVLQRLLEEADAGFSGADVVETNGTELYALGSEGVLLPVESPVTEDLVEGAAFDGWTTTRFNLFAVSWNTDLAEQPPTTWEELADPSWDGRVAMELSDADWYMSLHDYWIEQGRSEDEIAQLFEGMADGALIVSGHTLMAQLLAAGEFASATSNYSYIVQSLADEGAPVAWEPPVEPVIGRPNGVGLVQGVQHPAAALLFYEWMLTDGQDTLLEQNIDPSRQDLVTTGDAELVIVDLDQYAAERDMWNDQYEELLQLGEVLEE